MKTSSRILQYCYFCLMALLIILIPWTIDAQDKFVESILDTKPRMDVIAKREPIPRLLKKYKPRVYVAPESYIPVNFYRDYLPHTVIKNSEGEVILDSPDKGDLKDFYDKSGYYLDFQITTDEALSFRTKDVSPTFYARIYRDTFSHQNFQQRLIFLKYTAVFPYSGLASKMPWWKRLASHVAGDPYGWHELDIHGAVHVIVRVSDCRPLGLLLAQHNYHRVYWRGIDFNWSVGNSPTVSFAKYSNEPYLISDARGTRQVRTVGDPRNLFYLYHRKDDAPLGSGQDVIVSPEDGARKISMQLKMLPSNDPLYKSQIPLGDKMKILYFWSSWFREGPPGINFYAPPRLINLADLTAFYDIERNNEKFFSMLKNSEFNLDTFPPKPIMRNRKRKMKNQLETLNSIYPPSGESCLEF